MAAWSFPQPPLNDRIFLSCLPPLQHSSASFAACVLVLKARAELIRQKVDAYEIPYFESFGFRDDDGNPIARPSDLYLCTKDEARVQEFYKGCLDLHAQNGFPGMGEKCPALSAAEDLRQAEQAMLQTYCDAAGLEFDRLLGSMDSYNRLREMLLQIAANEPAVRRQCDSLLATK